MPKPVWQTRSSARNGASVSNLCGYGIHRNFINFPVGSHNDILSVFVYKMHRICTSGIAVDKFCFVILLTLLNKLIELYIQMWICRLDYVENCEGKNIPNFPVDLRL